MKRMDAHVHLGNRNGKRMSTKDLMDEMDRSQIEKSFVFAMTSKRGLNQQLYEDTKNHRERLIPFAYINPWHEDAREQLIHCVKDFGFRGLKLHPVTDGFPGDSACLLDPLLEVCDQYNMHVIIHCTSEAPYSSPLQVEKTAQRWPGVSVQMAHMGGCWLANEAITIALRNSNIYLDSATVSASAVTRAALRCGDKLLMGTDIPFYYFEMETLKMQLAADGDEDLLDRVSGGNMAGIIEERGLLL